MKHGERARALGLFAHRRVVMAVMTGVLFATSLITPPTPPEPPGIDDGTAAAVLDEAERIINSVGASVLADVRAQQQHVRFGRIKRMFGRKRS